MQACSSAEQVRAASMRLATQPNRQADLDKHLSIQIHTRLYVREELYAMQYELDNSTRTWPMGLIMTRRPSDVMRQCS